MEKHIEYEEKQLSYDEMHAYLKIQNKNPNMVQMSNIRIVFSDPISYLCLFEKVEGFPLKYSDKISINQLDRLISELYQSLDIIHQCHYYVDVDHIFIEGSKDDWKRITFNRNYNPGNDDTYYRNVHRLAYLIYCVIVESPPENNPNSYVPRNIKELIQASIDEHHEYEKHLTFLLWIFTEEPTTKWILEKLNVK